MNKPGRNIHIDNTNKIDSSPTPGLPRDQSKPKLNVPRHKTLIDTRPPTDLTRPTLNPTEPRTSQDPNPRMIDGEKEIIIDIVMQKT